ncbi:MAG: PAS domain-containing protein [Alphaproteobacteria bacterium]|nr:PAS domain-containing protein [Alphaproteobacteria bacterium]
MSKPVVAFRHDDGGEKISADGILNALSATVVVLDADGIIVHVNTAGEHFLQGGAEYLKGKALRSLLPNDNPVFSLIEQVRKESFAISEYGVDLESPRIGRHLVNLQAAPIPDEPDFIVLTMQQRTIADTIDRQLTHRGAARSVTAMAAMLAHEVKNPLSGIRGAAQLLEQNAKPDDASLTTLIREETDRICDLVDRMEVFSDAGPLKRDSVNIHIVLDRVMQLAKNGFGRHLRYVTNFDPSLPPVLGHRDQLIQVFLNLVKNAAEAAPVKGGEITLETAYQHGVRFAVPGTSSRIHLPLRISIKDNGEGIPDDIKSCLFDPFVTSKPQGTGLGLALVAKIIGDHGGVIECNSMPKRTEFRIMLPMAEEPQTANSELETAP